MKVNKINLGRRIIQVICLLLIIYSGSIIKNNFPAHNYSQNMYQYVESLPNNNIFPKPKLLKPHESAGTAIINFFPPFLSCRFNPNGGLFKGCIMYYLQANLTWLKPLIFLLPTILVIFLLLFIFGRFWCGWVCPIGAIGDFISFIRNKLNINFLHISNSAKYLIRIASISTFLLSLVISFLVGFPYFSRFQCFLFLPYCQLCPARLICPNFDPIRHGPEWKDFSTVYSTSFTFLSWLILIFFIFSFFYFKRLWCRFCPVGLFNSWFNKGCLLELKIIKNKCNKCGACVQACPMYIDKMLSVKKDTIYNDKNCIFCLQCITACPQNNCLSLNILGKSIVKSKYP